MSTAGLQPGTCRAFALRCRKSLALSFPRRGESSLLLELTSTPACTGRSIFIPLAGLQARKPQGRL
jgi:hypothetical protein